MSHQFCTMRGLSSLGVLLTMLLLMPSPAPSQSVYVIEMPTIGARTAEIASNLTKMMLAKDFDAAMLLVRRGDARFFEKGTLVFLMESGGIWSSSCKVRAKGDPDGWWVPDHIVKRQEGPASESLEGRLLAACKDDEPVLVPDLISRGANVNTADKAGWTPLLWACFNSNSELIELLVRKGADVSARNRPNQWTPLLALNTSKAGEASVRLLVGAGAVVNAQAADGATVLMRCAGVGKIGIVEFLLASGADINAIDKSGWTALMTAAYAGNRQMVDLLLMHGADLRTRTIHGKTALDIAKERQQQGVIDLLLAANR